MNGELRLASHLQPSRPKTVGELEIHAEALSKMASAILTELTTGKYDKELAVGKEVLTNIATAIPAFGAIERGLEFFLWINRITAPSGPIISDGRGGWVPANNSRYNPETGEFL